MVKIGKGKISDSINTVVKGLIIDYIENNNDLRSIRVHFNYKDPKTLNNTRKMLMQQYEDKYSEIVFVSNNILKEIIQEIIDQEIVILSNHLKDLTKHNSEFLQDLRDHRVEEDIEKIIETYENQHSMTKCGIKNGIYIASPDTICNIIDQL